MWSRFELESIGLPAVRAAPEHLHCYANEQADAKNDEQRGPDGFDELDGEVQRHCADEQAEAEADQAVDQAPGATHPGHALASLRPTSAARPDGSVGAAANPLARSLQKENIYEIKRFEKNRVHQEHFV